MFYRRTLLEGRKLLIKKYNFSIYEEKGKKYPRLQVVDETLAAKGENRRSLCTISPSIF
jgi:hypothetical protein